MEQWLDIRVLFRLSPFLESSIRRMEQENTARNVHFDQWFLGELSRVGDLTRIVEGGFA